MSARRGELSCEALAKVYPRSNRSALSGVSFSVPTNGVFTLIGRNGAGKTTLTRILATILEPSSGRATIDGLDVMTDAKRLRERIAVVPQEGRTVSWMTPVQTVSSYLLWRGYGMSESRARAIDAINAVGISQYADRLNTTLSGGVKRKVLVAMVLASEADIIFLDEPTTGLDPISRRQLWDLLISLGERRFVFLTTHYLEEAEQVSDKLAILNDGRLISIGTLEELRSNLKYQFSLKLPANTPDLPEVAGEKFVRKDGGVQIITTEDEALSVTKLLVERRLEFSLNPVTLDDIFYYYVTRDEQRGAVEAPAARTATN